MAAKAKHPGKSNAREADDGTRIRSPELTRAMLLYNESLECMGIDGHTVNMERSFELNERAAELGYTEAILAMGWYYVGGRGVARDLARAELWYRRSARRGEPKAMFSLGQIAYNGGSYQDARSWFERATTHGHVRSFYWLGKIAWRGHLAPRNPTAAYALFHRAAQGNDPEAVRALRFLSRRRKGVGTTEQVQR